MVFDKADDDYKVVRIVYIADQKRKVFGEVAPKVEIYSLRKDTWREMENPKVPRLVYDHGIYVDGCYYWLESNQPGTEETRKCYGNKMRIMSFDFRNELFGEFKVPDDVPHSLGNTSLHKLMRFENSLVLCVLGPPFLFAADARFTYCIWLMRQENGVVTWTLRFRALLKECGYPLDITKNGTLIVRSFRPNNSGLTTGIVSCNLKTMIHKYHGFGKPVMSVGVSSVDTSFPESLIMCGEGKSLLKYAK